ncbi:MAG TPA: hypothetical protein VIJ41_01040 [Candidatus Nanopelagicales bacterium]
MMSSAYRVRQVVNVLNLSTLLGLLVAKASGAALSRGADGIVLATGAHGSFPRASAFTVGNVVILRTPSPSAELLRHESRHATQWACCVVLFLPLYWLAALWSYARTGDHYSRNTFERRAGLTDGGYHEHAPRPLRRPHP